MSNSFPLALHTNLSPFLPSFLVDNPLYQNQTARVLLFSLGTSYVLSKVLSYGISFLQPLFHNDKTFVDKYGKGSWVFITGANNGIGQGFVIELASRGFNIILLGRDEQRLSEVVDEVHKKFPLIQTKVLVEDLSKSHEEGYAERLYDQVSHLDISILINNAGQMTKGYYYQQKVEEIRDSILVNCVAPAVLTRVFLPKLSVRKQKSAIIFLSSKVASYPRPIQQVYGATKTYNEYLARGLAMEYPNIDIIALKPGKVRTSMTDDHAVDMMTITPAQFAKVSLRYLGKTSHTYAHWKHRWASWGTDIIPEPLKVYYFHKKFPYLKR